MGEFSKRGGVGLDVYVAQGVLPEATRVALRRRLEALMVIRPARFYETRIDPNVGADDGLWVPTVFRTYGAPAREFVAVLLAAFRRDTGGRVMPREVVKKVLELCGGDVPSEGRCVIRSRVPDLDSRRHGNLYTLLEDIFQGSLHLLARLGMPALLFPGALQVVVKAQSIVLDEGEEYAGVWNDDGLREHVVAVVLFYYNVSPAIAGGALEFASKHKPLLCDDDYCGDPKRHLNPAGVRNASRGLPRCIVPVETGTYVVFSNYAAVHRVLPAEAVAAGGSRDFLAFFVIDQKSSLPMPEDRGPLETRLQRRVNLLGEQLETRGCFGLDGSSVYSAGNGCLAEIAWLTGEGRNERFLGDSAGHGLLRGAWLSEPLGPVIAAVSALNMKPPVRDRGSSYLADLGSELGDCAMAEHCEVSPWVQVLLSVPAVELSVFIHQRSFIFQAEPPEEGVAEVRRMKSYHLFEEEGYWTNDEALEARMKLALCRESELGGNSNDL